MEVRRRQEDEGEKEERRDWRMGVKKSRLIELSLYHVVISFLFFLYHSLSIFLGY